MVTDGFECAEPENAIDFASQLRLSLYLGLDLRSRSAFESARRDSLRAFRHEIGDDNKLFLCLSLRFAKAVWLI